MLAARSLGARWIAPVMIAIATLVPLGGASTAAAQEAALAISIDSPGPYAPGETVMVSIAGGTPHGDAIIAQCAVSPLACLYSGSLPLDGDGAGTAEVRIKRYRMGEDFVADCAVVACDLRVYLQPDGEGPTASTPITIDPSAPLVRPVVSVEPDDALAGRDTVLVTGEGFEPDRTVLVTECQWTAHRHVPARGGRVGRHRPGRFLLRVRAGHAHRRRHRLRRRPRPLPALDRAVRRPRPTDDRAARFRPRCAAAAPGALGRACDTTATPADRHDHRLELVAER